MPLSYAITDERVIELRLTGRVTASDFRGFFAASQADPVYQPHMHRLILAEDVTGFPSGDEIQGIAARTRDRAVNSPARFAIVTRDPLAIGVSNMIFRLAGLSGRFQIFESGTDARRWLIDPDEAPAEPRGTEASTS